MNAAVSWEMRPGNPDQAHALARSLVARALALAPEQVALTHACPRCASADHGPLIALEATTRRPLPVHLSISRAARGSQQWIAAAVSTQGQVGIDIEGGVDSPELRHWVRAEAALKALGVGVRIDPDQLSFAEHPVRLTHAPSPIDPSQFTMRDLPIPAHDAPASGHALVAALAVLQAIGPASVPAQLSQQQQATAAEASR